MYELIQALADEYGKAQSLDELHRTTARLVQRQTNADFGVVAVREERTVRALATEPADWTDTDGLLSPVSLPNIASSRGQSYVIDDKSNVRSAAEAEPVSHGPKVTYPSIMWAPFSDSGFLLAGSTDKSAFYDLDLERLRVISALSSVLRQPVRDATRQRDQQEFVKEAMTFLTHDAKNLLSVVNGRLQLARESPDDEQFDVIESSLGRLEELIGDTETLLETGDHVTDREPITIREAANSAWESLETERANLLVEPTETILAGESRYYQLLENLFRNALDHAGPDVTVRVGVLDDARGFYVEDDGPGIEPSARDSLFELGYSSSEDNTGVGLNIVARIADAHDWQISVTDAEMGGARFEFSGVEFVDDATS